MLTNLPNLLTLSRIGAIPLLIVTFYLGSPVGNWSGLGILVLAGLTDYLDGYFARAWSQQSLIGKFLDPIADKLLVAALILMLVATARIDGLAILPAIVILCREILVSGLREFLAGVRSERTGQPAGAMENHAADGGSGISAGRRRRTDVRAALDHHGGRDWLVDRGHLDLGHGIRLSAHRPPACR